MLTLLRIGWTNLKRDRVAQTLTFVLPIVFFSIFASVFGGRGDDPTPRVVDRASSTRTAPSSAAAIVDALGKESALRVRAADPGAAALDRAGAERLVRNGDVPVAVVIPKGVGDGVRAERLRERRAVDRPARRSVGSGRAADGAGAAAEGHDDRGSRPDDGGRHEAVRGARRRADPEQRKAVDAWLPTLKADAGTGGASTGGAGAMGMAVDVVDVMRTDDRKGSLISFYAAGIGVMFLLFSAVGGAGGALLDEAESGTLERLLSTNIGMTGLLAGKWLFLTLIGTAQLTRDVPVGAGRVRPAAVLAHPGLPRDDGRDRRRRRGARPGARHAGAHPGAAVRLLDAADPDDVGARRQHVPALPDERDDAEDGAGDVQRLGARRIPEGVLAQRRGLGAVAAGARPRRARRHVPRRSPGCWRGAGSSRERAAARALAICIAAIALSVGACRNLDVVTEATRRSPRRRRPAPSIAAGCRAACRPGPASCAWRTTSTRTGAGGCSIFRRPKPMRCARSSGRRFRSTA